MSPEISVIVPVHNEEGNVERLAREIAAAFDGQPYEMIFVDDASRDGTLATLVALKADLPALRVIRHANNAGQSRALRSGAEAARGAIMVTLDGDGQNDPADAPRLVEILKAGMPELGLVGGLRTKRQDTWARRYASKFGNAVRRAILNDNTSDTGCGLKAMPLKLFLALPYFDHMHRYLPALTHRMGLKTAFSPVNHRSRESGVSKYTNLERLWASIWDMAGVLWLARRARAHGEASEA